MAPAMGAARVWDRRKDLYQGQRFSFFPQSHHFPLLGIHLILAVLLSYF